MVWGAIAAAAIPAAMSYLGGREANAANAAQAQANRGFQAEQTQAQMDFQERMRKTQYQTTVEDLKAAGLNPMLAYSQGGAGTPSGASAGGAQAQMENIFGRVGQSAKEGALAYQQFKNMQVQNFTIEQQGEAAAADALLKKDQAALTRADTLDRIQKTNATGKFGNMQDTILRGLQNSAEQAQSTSALQKAQTNREDILADLNKMGIAPSSAKAIYNDIKRTGKGLYNSLPYYAQPFGQLK